jgi:aspartate/methionine/tyrosine aminotransferase
MGPTLNRVTEKMRKFTLRDNDATRIIETAETEKKPIIEGRLGDPNRHGLKPYRGYLRAVRDLAVAEEEERLSTLKHEIGELDSAHQYTASAGFPPLRKLLADECGLKPSDIFIGGGESGIARSIFDTVLIPGEDSIIPLWTYIMFYSETVRREGNIVSIELDEQGEPRLDQLKDAITKNTKCVNITTVGNPMGISIKPETMEEIIRIVNVKEGEFDSPIYLFVDTEYEGFRDVRDNRIDPIKMSREFGRIGPTIELYSASKMLGIPGSRVGWAKVYWNEENFPEQREEFYSRLNTMGIGLLGDSALFMQIALFMTFNRINTLPEEKTNFDLFKTNRREIVSGRTHNFLKGVADIDGIVLPKYYYRNGVVPRRIIDSFYVMFGVDEKLLPRSGMSQAAALAKFAYEHGLPVPALTPEYHFTYTPGLELPFALPALFEYRPKDIAMGKELKPPVPTEEILMNMSGQELMRAVALFSEEKLNLFLDVLEQFVRDLKVRR